MYCPIQHLLCSKCTDRFSNYSKDIDPFSNYSALNVLTHSGTTLLQMYWIIQQILCSKDIDPFSNYCALNVLTLSAPTVL